MSIKDLLKFKHMQQIVAKKSLTKLVQKIRLKINKVVFNRKFTSD